MKKCPYCGKENPDDATVCALDQQPLDPVPKAPAPRKLSSEEIRAHLATRPLAVKFAVGLLAFGAGLDLIRIIIKYHSYFSRHINFSFSMIWTNCFVTLLLYCVFCGKNWARWVLVGILLLSMVPFSSVHQLHWESYFYLAINAAAITALFKRASNEWFTKLKKVRMQLLPSV